MKKIVVRVADGTAAEFAGGITVGQALQEGVTKTPPTAGRPLAAFVNNEVRSLSYRLHINATIVPIYADSDEGQRVYRRSLSFALAIAAHRAFPNRRLLIGHSLGNAIFYSFDGHATTAADLVALDTELRALVSADLEIRRGVVSYQDALDFFNARGMRDSALLVERQNYSEIPVYSCGDYMDLSHGPLVARTGLLDVFALEAYADGFLLVFATVKDTKTVTAGHRSAMLYEIYKEHKEWGRILQVPSVGHLNHLTETGQIKDFIRVAETLHNKKIAEIADKIKATGETEKVVLLAGPSSSGKTTSTKKLAVQLTVVGYRPVVISLDDYFVPRERTPRDEHGNYDFESLHALDIDLLNEHLIALFAGQEVEIPRFNFKTGQPEYRGNTLRLTERSILLMEGIHGLNDELTPRIPRERKFKVYVSALTQLNVDDHTRIATTDNRLIRRIVRDYQFRGHNARDTLKMWPSVRRGEDRNIFPFQDSADAVFNSALDYELGVLRTYAEPLLRQVKPMDPFYYEAMRLQTFLRNFTAIPEKLVPAESILREFIGDSEFHY